MEPQPSQADPVDIKFERPELVSRPREPTPPAGGSAEVPGGRRSAWGANGRSADPCRLARPASGNAARQSDCRLGASQRPISVTRKVNPTCQMVTRRESPICTRNGP